MLHSLNLGLVNHYLLGGDFSGILELANLLHSSKGYEIPNGHFLFKPTLCRLKHCFMFEIRREKEAQKDESRAGVSVQVIACN